MLLLTEVDVISLNFNKSPRIDGIEMDPRERKRASIWELGVLVGERDIVDSGFIHTPVRERICERVQWLKLL